MNNCSANQDELYQQFFYYHILNEEELQINAAPLKLQEWSPISTPTDRNIDFWHTKWGKLLSKLSAIENGPSIGSRDFATTSTSFRIMTVPLTSSCVADNDDSHPV